MQRVDQRVSHTYLGIAPPRPFPQEALPDMLIDYILRPAFRKLIDPVIALGILILIGFSAFGVAHTFGWAIGFLILVRVWREVRFTIRRVREELTLLRYGQLVRAHVLQMRPYRSELGEIDGAIFDCAIAVAPRRTYVGNFWLSDGAEAVEIAKTGHITVICLPATPGTWRVIEDLRSEIRYDRKGPIAHIPQDIY
jgi:hypothetical protein